MRAVALALAALLAAPPGLALAVPCPGALPLAAGAPAPCGGLLVPAHQGAEALACVVSDLPGCRLGLARTREKSRLTLQACQTGREAAQEQADALEGRLAAITATSEPPHGPPWYASPGLWAGLGLALGLVAGFTAADRLND